MALEELTMADDQIEVMRDGSLQIREATIILRDGEPEPSIPAQYHRYVLHPGEDVTGKSERIVAVAAAVWTPEVVAAYRALSA